MASRATDDIASRPVPPLEMVESALAAFLKVQVDLKAANGLKVVAWLTSATTLE